MLAVVPGAMTLSQQLELVAERSQSDNPGLRHGQALFNALHDMRPHLANKVRGTAMDPFGNDSVISEFLKRVDKAEAHD